MNARKIVRILSVASLVLVTGSLGRGLATKAEAKAIDRPAAQSSAALEAQQLVFVEPGQAFDERLPAHAFVVLRRADGHVPRAYVWDEPLGCPDAHAE